MSEMPTTIQVGPIEYVVIEDMDRLMREEHAQHKSRLFGCVAYFPSEIIIRPEQSASQKRDTLLHEIVHALDHAYDLFPDDDKLESTVAKAATAILDTLRRNPALVAYLTEGAR